MGLGVGIFRNLSIYTNRYRNESVGLGEIVEELEAIAQVGLLSFL